MSLRFKLWLMKYHHQRKKMMKEHGFDIKDIRRIFDDNIFYEIRKEDINPYGTIHKTTIQNAFDGTIEISDWKTRRMWGGFSTYHPVNVGDYIVQKMNSGRFAVFLITDIKYSRYGNSFSGHVEDIGYWKNLE